MKGDEQNYCRALFWLVKTANFFWTMATKWNVPTIPTRGFANLSPLTPPVRPHEAFEIETDNHDGPAREQSAKGYVRNRANYSIPRFVKPQFRTSISAAGNG